MTQIQIQKVFAFVALGALMLTNFAVASAATQIGTGSVTGSGAFDTAIMWDDNFPGTASGAVTDIIIKARVLPTLNMEISDAEIDLGVLVPGTPGTGNLSIEVGTNAVSGLSITARSQQGGLTNLADASVQINDLTTDGIAESYTWASVINATNDSSFTAYTAENTTGDGLNAAAQINDNTTEYNVYTTNNPEASSATIDDVQFNVEATATAETPAGEYEDRVTFTVTGNF